MTLAALDASLVYDCNVAYIVWIEIYCKFLTVYNVMTADLVEIICRPMVKGLINASEAISLSHQVESLTPRGAIGRLTLLNAISGKARA